MRQAPLRDLQHALTALDLEVAGWLESMEQKPSGSALRYVPDIELAYQRLQSGMGRNTDVLMRKLSVPSCPEGPVLIACLDGMADTQMVDQDIIQRLLTSSTSPHRWDETTITPAHITASDDWRTLLQSLAAGNTLIFAPGLPHSWIVDTVKFPQRSISRPQTERSVKGPEEGFTEVLLTQKTQIRRHFLSPDLQFHDIKIGRDQHTTVSIAYLDHLTNPALVDTAIRRVSSIDIAGQITSTTIAGLIRDHPLSIFPTMRATERVDVVTWRLLEGAVAILTDGDPFALVAPAPLMDFYRTTMDYSGSWIDSSFVRMIRLAGWLLSMYLPAFYIALAEVNPSILPTPLYIVMQGSHAGLPFPPTVEVVLMIMVIEILRESALRLPTVLSGTLGTVGAIVVGTAVVKAGLVDPQIIVMITLTALALFSTPVYELTGSWRTVSFIFIASAAILGIVGIVIASVVLMTILIDMQSFGVPYFTPWAPFRPGSAQDTIFRLPWTRFVARWSVSRPLRIFWRHPSSIAGRPHLAKRRQQIE